MSKKVRSNIQHFRYYSTFDHLNECKNVVSYKRWIERQALKHRHNHDLEYIFRLTHIAECRYIENGRPYYKIWPHIAEELTRTNLQINYKYLHFPYNCFEVRLPRSEFLPLFSKYQALLVMHIKPDDIDIPVHPIPNDKAFDSIRKNNYEVLYLFWIENHQHHRTQFILGQENTLEDSLEVHNLAHTQYEDEIKEKYPHILTRFALDDLLRIIFGISMFAIGKHELVLPDVQTPIIDKSQFGRGKKAKEKIKALERQLKQKQQNNKGWLVGSEIDLPYPEYVGAYQKKETGEEKRELQFGHVRTGHMRRQPCGKGNKERKLIYIPPHPCRPDLPMRTHGYRIQDNIKRIS